MILKTTVLLNCAKERVHGNTRGYDSKEDEIKEEEKETRGERKQQEMRRMNRLNRTRRLFMSPLLYTHIQCVCVCVCVQ